MAGFMQPECIDKNCQACAAKPPKVPKRVVRNLSKRFGLVANVATSSEVPKKKSNPKVADVTQPRRGRSEGWTWMDKNNIVDFVVWVIRSSTVEYQMVMLSPTVQSAFVSCSVSDIDVRDISLPLLCKLIYVRDFMYLYYICTLPSSRCTQGACVVASETRFATVWVFETPNLDVLP